MESTVYFDMSAYNLCAHQYVAGAAGEPQLPPGALVFSDSMQSAALNVDAVGMDYTSGSPVPVPVSIHLTWSNGVLTVEGAGASHYRVPSEIDNSRTSGTEWYASVSGSVRGGATEYADNPSSGGLFEQEGVFVFVNQKVHSPALAAAATATSTITGQTTYQSADDAQLGWEKWDASGCVVNYGYVQAQNRRPGSDWGVTTDTYSALTVSRMTYDSCTGTWLSAIYGSKLLDPSQLRITLGGTSLTTTVDGYDYLAGVSEPVVVDLRWRGTGVPSSLQGTGQNEAAGVKYQTHTDLMWRDADISGSVTEGGSPLLDGSPTVAVLSTYDLRVHLAP